ncbi:hypothetical protein M0802_001704 [Mischocyttarus mexicanus]|nr:hypothetical protein M0802_001704 [Mischocyttarus mexicanus]
MIVNEIIGSSNRHSMFQLRTEQFVLERKDEISGVLTGFSKIASDLGNHLVDHGIPYASYGRKETSRTRSKRVQFVWVGRAVGFSWLLEDRYLLGPLKSPKMSLLPLPKVQCVQTRRRKYPQDVAGTANISYGHRFRDRGECKIVKERESIFDKLAERDAKERIQYEKFLKSWEFEKETNRKIRIKAVQDRVEKGMAMYEESINVRREKLRDLILKEEMGLTREIVEQAQHGDDFRMDEMREETERLMKQQEEERLALLAEKRMQQYIERCPELRERLTKRFAKDAKSCNLVQMADNEAKKLAENELEELWHELMLREIKAKEDREIEEAKKRFYKEQDALTTLAKQVAGKLALEEEEKRVKKEEREYLEQLWDNVRKEETTKLETERKKRESLKKELIEQATRAKRILIERAEEETKIDVTLNDLAKEELIREKTAIKESSIALREELLAYLKYLEELREEETRRNLEVDKIVEESMKDANARRDLAVKRFKEMRESNLREVLLGREEQLRIKRESIERDKRSLENEKIVLEKEIETDAKLCAIMRQEEKMKMINYGKELKEQQKYCEAVKAREREEDEKIYRDGLKREEDYRKLNEELLKATENVVTQHPFKKLLLKEHDDTRLVPEKRGLCYCPPPPLLPSSSSSSSSSSSLPQPIETLLPSTNEIQVGNHKTSDYLGGTRAFSGNASTLGCTILPSSSLSEYRHALTESKQASKQASKQVSKQADK